MCRLLIHVEGQTEETFVNNILAPHLYTYGYTRVSARLIGNARLRTRRGGICPWPIVRKEILNRLKEDHGCIVTTMVDYYGLPQTGDQAWPGRQTAGALPFKQKACTIETALLNDISSGLENNLDVKRFIPYVTMHEFEGLLFSDCERFGYGISRPDLIEQFKTIRNQFTTPEEINDSPNTAPSKRVETLVPGYQKPLLGTSAILEIGLDTIRAECPHFCEWLEHLEGFLKKAEL